MSVIHNERTKLRANGLDRLSTTFVAIGCVAPWVAVAPDIGGARLLGLALTTFALAGQRLDATAFFDATLGGLAPMTPFEVFTLVILPVAALAFSGAMYWWSGRAGR
jgi:hypothetical protein